MPKCRNCGKDIKRYEEDICPYCGVANPVPANYETMDVTKTIRKLAEENDTLYRSKSKKTYVLLCLFLGVFGVHEFYILKKKRGAADILITILITGILGLSLFFLAPLSFFSFLIGFGVAYLFFVIYSFVLRGADSLRDGNGEYLR